MDIVNKWVAHKEVDSLVLAPMMSVRLVYDAASKNGTKCETRIAAIRGEQQSGQQQCGQQRTVTCSLREWCLEFDRVREYMSTVDDAVERLETLILFAMFPRYSACNNVPYLYSDFKTFKSIDRFMERLERVDSFKITSPSQKIKLIFGLSFIDQVIVHLMGGEGGCCTRLDDDRLSHNTIDAFVDEVFKFFKENSTKKTLKTHRVDEFTAACRDMDPTVINTLFLVLFKCIEKHGKAGGYFKRLCSAY